MACLEAGQTLEFEASLLSLTCIGSWRSEIRCKKKKKRRHRGLSYDPGQAPGGDEEALGRGAGALEAQCGALMRRASALAGSALNPLSPKECASVLFGPGAPASIDDDGREGGHSPRENATVAILGSQYPVVISIKGARGIWGIRPMLVRRRHNHQCKMQFCESTVYQIN